jgi:predicted neutral ceramidase superfamily lipid hydrolase
MFPYIISALLKSCVATLGLFFVLAIFFPVSVGGAFMMGAILQWILGISFTLKSIIIGTFCLIWAVIFFTISLDEAREDKWFYDYNNKN